MVKTNKKLVKSALKDTKLLESESLPDLVGFENEEREIIGYEQDMQHLLDGPDDEVKKLIEGSSKSRAKGKKK